MLWSSSCRPVNTSYRSTGTLPAGWPRSVGEGVCEPHKHTVGSVHVRWTHLGSESTHVIVKTPLELIIILLASVQLASVCLVLVSSDCVSSIRLPECADLDHLRLFLTPPLSCLRLSFHFQLCSFSVLKPVDFTWVWIQIIPALSESSADFCPSAWSPSHFRPHALLASWWPRPWNAGRLSGPQRVPESLLRDLIYILPCSVLWHLLTRSSPLFPSRTEPASPIKTHHFHASAPTQKHKPASEVGQQSPNLCNTSARRCVQHARRHFTSISITFGFF